MPSFLHAADLHLDSPLRGLDQKPNAPTARLREASRRAFERLIDQALARKVAFAVLSGDLYDIQPAFETYRFFHQQMNRLAGAHIPVAIVLGNHDHAGIAPRAGRLPEGVRQLSKDAAESWELVPSVVVHGQSYPRRDVTVDLRAGYPAPVAGKLNIGLLHTALAGYEGEHAAYAPTSAAALSHHGYQYWALGHVHKHLALVEGGVHIVFPGNLQGRHARETGPKGAVFVDYTGARIDRVQHEAFDDVRWHHVEVDAASLPEGKDPALAIEARVLSETAQTRSSGRLAAVRVTVEGEASRQLVDLGETELRETLRVHLEEDESIFLEKVQTDLRAVPAERSEAERQLAVLAETLCREPEGRALIGEQLEEVRRKLKDTDVSLLDSGLFAGKRGSSLSEENGRELLDSALGLLRELMRSHGGRE